MNKHSIHPSIYRFCDKKRAASRQDAETQDEGRKHTQRPLRRGVSRLAVRNENNRRWGARTGTRVRDRARCVVHASANPEKGVSEIRGVRE